MFEDLFLRYVPIGQKLFFFVRPYSVLSAITGSFLLAIFAGINPAIIVNIMLIATSIIPATFPPYLFSEYILSLMFIFFN